MVTDGLIDAIRWNLENHLSVKLGDFGTFRPAFGCKSQENGQVDIICGDRCHSVKGIHGSLNKIEQKNISAGKKYQQAFARKKDVVFKEGVYSRVDYPGKGKISGNDLVTVVIKEMLTDGTVINDMEAKDQALTQKLDAYPPVFREPLKRLQNHGSVTLVVPPEKAYGSKGLPPKIPPGATMVYSVRIVDSQPEPAK